jgi:hypothetical protein
MGLMVFVVVGVVGVVGYVHFVVYGFCNMSGFGILYFSKYSWLMSFKDLVAQCICEAFSTN